MLTFCFVKGHPQNIVHSTIYIFLFKKKVVCTKMYEIYQFFDTQVYFVKGLHIEYLVLSSKSCFLRKVLKYKK